MKVSFEWPLEVLIGYMHERLENILQVAIIRIKDEERLSSIKLFLIPPYPTTSSRCTSPAIIHTSLQALNYSLSRVSVCPLLNPSSQGICLIHFLFCNLYVPVLTNTRLQNKVTEFWFRAEENVVFYSTVVLTTELKSSAS